MTPEERHLLDKVMDLAEENNKILRSMRRANRISTIFHVLYYIVLIAAAIGAFYYFQPYIDSLMRTYSTFKSGFDQLQHFGQATSTL